MTRSFVLISLCLFAFSAAFSTSQAFAGTNPIFSRDGKKGTVLIRGMPGDTDASSFYNLLAGPPVEQQGKWTKKASFTGADGVRSFDVVCAYSKMIPDNGSCILVLRVAEGMTIGSGRITYRVTGDTAARLAKLFAIPADATQGAHEIYHSQDHHLTMNIEVNSADQKIHLFQAEYR
jgi:hypothetical protein